MQLESGNYSDVRIGAKPTARPWLLVAASVVAVVCGLLILAARSRTLATATFPDGSRVSALAVTNGKVHKFDGRTLGERILERIGPLRVLGRQNLFTHKTERLGEVLWLRLDRRYPALMETVGATYHDEHGCAYPGKHPEPISSGNIGTGAARIYALQPPTVSPSAKRLVVKVHRQGGTAARLEMAAARRAPNTHLETHDLPISYSAQGVTTTLRRLTQEHEWGADYAAMHVDYQEGDRPNTRLSPIWIETTDTGGNVMSSMVYRLPKDAEDVQYDWGFLAPCRLEPAWKMRVYSAANDWETRKPDRSWRLTLPRYSSRVPSTATSGGITLNLRAGKRWGSAPGKIEMDEYLVKLQGVGKGCRLFLGQVEGQKVKDYLGGAGSLRRGRAALPHLLTCTRETCGLSHSTSRTSKAGCRSRSEWTGSTGARQISSSTPDRSCRTIHRMPIGCDKGTSVERSKG